MNLDYSPQEIEELAEGFIRRYIGNPPTVPLCVDIEGFVVNYLFLDVTYQKFAEKDYDKIGFIADGITPLLVYERGRPVKRVFPKGTVVLENWLLNDRETGRRRFTLAHEASHYIMDKTISRASFKRDFDRERNYDIRELRALFTMKEAQVDRLAAALLMPGFVVHNVLDQFAGIKSIPIYGANVFRLEDKLLVRRMADAMQVSYSAFLIRLKELNLLEYHPISEYITREIGLDGEIPF